MLENTRSLIEYFKEKDEVLSVEYLKMLFRIKTFILKDLSKIELE